MNKITVVSGDSFLDIANTMFGFLQPTFGHKNIVFCHNQEIERLIFESQKTEVVFNVETTSMQNFAKTFVQKPLVSNLRQKLIIKNILKTNNLHVLSGKPTNGLVQSVLQEIFRFQKNGLLPKDVLALKAKDQFLKEKLLDLGTIYEKYLETLLDSVDEGQAVAEFLMLKQDFSSFSFFVLGCYDLSPMEIKIINHLSFCGAKVFVGACCSQSPANGYLFNNELLNVLKQNFVCQIFPAKGTLSQNQMVVKDIAFSVFSEKQDLGFLQVFEANDIAQEVQNAARLIKKLLFTNQAQGHEIKVICGGIAGYAQVIENVFLQYGFNFHINHPMKAKDTCLAKFVLSCLQFFKTKSPESFLSAIFSDFSGVSEKSKMCVYENLANEEIEAFEQKLLQVSTQKPFECLLLLFDVFDLAEKQKNLVQKFQLQNQSGLADMLLEIGKEFDGFATNFSDFVEMFEDALLEATLPMPQLLENSILVCDATCPVAPAKFLFVLGAVQGQMPSVQNDTMILSDDAIKALGLFGSVLEKNRSIRFDIFVALQNFCEMLFVSYPLVDFSGQKMLASGFVKNFIQSAKSDNLTVLSKTNLGVEGLSTLQQATFASSFFGTKKLAEEAYLKNLQSHDFQFQELMPSFEKMFGKVGPQHKLELLVDKQKLFFDDNKTKVSQIESYYSCPFKHFMTYGLKLSQAKRTDFESQDIGNVLHKVAEKFLNTQSGFCNQDKSKVPEIVEGIFDEMKTNSNFEKLFLHKNRYSKQILKNEANRFCGYLFDVYHKSNFKPKFLEVYFGGENQKFELRVLEQDFSLVGIVDRVDVFQNNAVVLDYKTGSSAQGKNDELFYGEKIQIFVYAKAVQKLMNLNVKGVFYFPIINKFSDDGISPYFLHGKNVLQQSFLLNFDNTLSLENPKSTFFPCEIKTSKDALKNPELQFNQRSTNHTNQEDFENMMDYAIEMTKQGIAEILQGSIGVLPIEGACSFCPYKAICQKPDCLAPREKTYDVTNDCFGVCKGGNDGN